MRIKLYFHDNPTLPDEVYQPFAEIDENLTITKELYMTIASQL